MLGLVLGEWDPSASDKVLLALREDLTCLSLIGWSHPPKEPCSLFLSEQGRDFMQKNVSNDTPPEIACL
jgi:hypothetical protein